MPEIVLSAKPTGCQARQRTRRLLATASAIGAVVLLAVILAMTGRDSSTAAAQHDPAQPATRPADADDTILARGMQLYTRDCSACHGEKGLGDGPAAYLLYPKPRNFAEGQFRVTSAKSGLPTDQDLLQVLRRGMPGSAMPSWGHLPDGDLNALVRAVRELAIQGKIGQLLANSKTMKPERALKVAHSLLDPGAIAPLPEAITQDKIDLARGQVLYAANCAACHDADGRGRNKRDLTDNAGLPVFARDFTQGIFKGGSDPAALARRIYLGMPGSPMPAAADMPPADLWSLVAYVQTFIKPGAQQRVEQVQHTLFVARIAQNLTIDPNASVWSEVDAVFIPLMPLWWRDDRIEGVNFRAVHNGRQIAVQLSWDDATINDLSIMPQSFTDGAALQLAVADNPPFFAMGQKGGVVDIWHWKATRQYDRDAATSAFDAQYPNMPHDETPPPDFQTAVEAGNLVAPAKDSPSVECLRAAGFGTLSSRGPKAQLAQGGARRAEKGWSIVFLHELGAEEGDHEVVLAPGGAVSIAFAAWDGEAGDRNGQKSVSIWHRLELQK